MLLIAAFIAFFYLKKQTIINYKKYPPSTDCKSIAQMFNNDYHDPIFISVADQFDKENTMNNMGTGIYQCFCKNYPGDSEDVPFCDDYRRDFFIGLGLSQVVSFSIIFVNIILKTVNMLLIKYIGHNTESDQTQAIKLSIFVA